RKFKPRWNRQAPAWAGPLPEISLEEAALIIRLVDSDEELRIRRQSVLRIEAKLFHMLRALRKARVSGASPAILRALETHSKELLRLWRGANRGRRVNLLSEERTNEF